MIITPELIINIHRKVIEFGTDDEKSLKDAIRDYGCLPFICEYDFMCPDSIHKAAYYLHRISTRHPFIDGNKRTSFFVTMFILSKEMNVNEVAYDDNKENYIKLVASGERNIEEICDWINTITND